MAVSRLGAPLKGRRREANSGLDSVRSPKGANGRFGVHLASKSSPAKSRVFIEAGL
jgi:hypothetical protein